MEQAFQPRHLHHVWPRWKVHRVYSPGVKRAPEIIIQIQYLFFAEHGTIASPLDGIATRFAPHSRRKDPIEPGGANRWTDPDLDFIWETHTKELSMTTLRERMMEDMKVRNLAPNTQVAYIHRVSMFARHFGRSPETIGPEQIRSYQLYLTTEKKLAPATIAVTVAALRFLYNVTLQRQWVLEQVLPMPQIPDTLPVVLSPEEVLEFLDGVPHIKHRTILTSCYAAGLRISEAVHLKPAHIDSQRMVIRVEQGKGQKDRYVMLSLRLLETLRHWWRTERPAHWLFPGKYADKPITRHAVEKACQEAYSTAVAVFPSPSHPIPFAMHLPSTCWKTEPTSARSNCC